MPRVINVDNNPAYPAAMEGMMAEGMLPRRVRLRKCKYLNNVIEQDHRAVKKRMWFAKAYGSFLGAWRTLQGIEAVHMIRKGRRDDWPRPIRSVKRASSPNYSVSLCSLISFRSILRDHVILEGNLAIKPLRLQSNELTRCSVRCLMVLPACQPMTRSQSLSVLTMEWPGHHGPNGSDRQPRGHDHPKGMGLELG